MSSTLPNTVLKFLVALLKNQAKVWLGEEAAGIAAQTFIDEDLQKRLDDWLRSDETAKELLRAANQAQLYLQSAKNCPDDNLRRLFHGFSFADLPSVQVALNDLPQAMDASAVTEALRESFDRDLPNLSGEQREQGAKLYTDALMQALIALKDFIMPVIAQTVLANSKKLDKLGDGQKIIIAGQEEFKKLILETLENSPTSPSPTKPGDLPVGSYLPIQPNPNFTGRVDELKQLADALCSPLSDGDGPNVRSVIINQQALVGMGGIGKTQLAVHFAWQEGYRFAGVHWVSAFKAEEINSSIAQCGQAMGLQPWPQDIVQQAIKTIRAWMENGPRLVILDNIEDTQTGSNLLMRLRHSNIFLLITTRHNEFSEKLNLPTLHLNNFTKEEGFAFIRKHLIIERVNDAEVEILLQTLDCMPTYLDRAVHYLKRYATLSVTEYLQQYLIMKKRDDFPTRRITHALQFLKFQEDEGLISSTLADTFRSRVMDSWYEEFFK